MEIKKITRDYPEYPPLLNQIIDPPEQLFVRGNIGALSARCFAVIGSRDITDYGRRATDAIVSPIAHHFTIVSGMALGADACAHATALNAQKPTIAVLGGGIDDETIYPRSHISLAHKIIGSGGCIVSEYPPGEQPRPYYFPARNRIIAGLSVGVLIIEAAKDSGTMITARLALDYNRDVFAVPGSIFSKYSAGTHELLSQGAAIATNASQILETYGIKQNKNQISTNLNPDEKRIYDILSKHPCSINELITLTNKDPAIILEIVSRLEIDGVITHSGTKLISGL